jgi:sterol desaturase/sphingolipid hydroxylase (fatty acid hydroxylase superfamily)
LLSLARGIARHLYPLVLLGSLAAWVAALQWNWRLDLVVLALSLFALGLGALLERVAPFEPDWRRARADGATDALSAGLLLGLADPLLRLLLDLAARALLGSQSGDAWLLDGLPLALQLPLVILWIELAKYLMHRAHHELPPLWRLHALHHGSERLYWLNNFRFHPLNHALNTAFALLPLLLLGAPAELLLTAALLTQPILMLQHLNVATRSGWLNRVISTNELHRWHHSADPREANANYGSALIVWDRLLGTYRDRPGRPARIGLFGDGGGWPVHASYWRQLLLPLTPACCRA